MKNLSLKMHSLLMGGALVILFSGCSIFPYEENFACEAFNDYGRCLDVNGAYEVAVSGEKQGLKIEKNGAVNDGAEEAKNKAKQQEKTGIEVKAQPPYLDYRASVYQKMKRMVANPETPMVKQPDVIRTLVLNYKNNKGPGNPLYMHRFIYFFGSDPEWVLSPEAKKTDLFLPPLVNISE